MVAVWSAPVIQAAAVLLWVQTSSSPALPAVLPWFLTVILAVNAVLRVGDEVGVRVMAVTVKSGSLAVPVSGM